ncbi:MAG: DNA circularization N-terminal domain-containing protein [Rhodospirillales bacterium]|nr:DNA circularization N-terminal domain-containing protein [Rhodospirillales bacterium]
MSGALAALAAGAAPWMISLRPASFRGVPFYWDAAEGKGGRRIVVHAFPLRDRPFVEDLGRAPRSFRLRAFVVGDDYADQRDALISACEDYAEPGVLVHPTMGEISCHAGLLSWNESKTEGGWCGLDLEFVRAGARPSPTGAADTVSELLAGVGTLLGVISSAYQAASQVLTYPAAVVALAEELFSQAAGALSALPVLAVGGLAPQIAAVAAAGSSDAAAAAAVGAVFSAAAAAVVAAIPGPLPTEDPVAGDAPVIAGPADPTYGLLGLASWNAAAAAPAGTGPWQAAQAAQQAAVVSLVQGSALAAALTVYANTDWQTANAAAAARALVLPLLDAQSEAAADAGQDALYLAWQAVTAQTMADFIARAQGLPTLVDYALGEAMPSLVLAERWYQDATRAVELETLNDSPQPLFLPPAGVRLSS